MVKGNVKFKENWERFW